MAKPINIIKANGKIEPFDERKVIGSLIRAGASSGLAQKIVDRIKPSLYQNIPSFQIYDAVMKILKKEQRPLAEKYNLKRAIMDLGPSGYPFEKFVAEVLKASGYKIELNQIVMGKCVSHEIDVIARRDKKVAMVECKFHNRPGGRTDIKAALYSYARFLDIKAKGYDQPWLITNTKLSQDVKSYALCMGMRVTAWDYPETGSLRELVDESGLHPITAMTALSKKKIEELLSQGIVLCRDYKNYSI
jgi:hypothetical protein